MGNLFPAILAVVILAFNTSCVIMCALKWKVIREETRVGRTTSVHKVIQSMIDMLHWIVYASAGSIANIIILILYLLPTT